MIQKKLPVSLCALLLVGLIATAEGEQSSEVDQWCQHLSKELRSVKLDSCRSRQWIVEAKSVQGRPIPYFLWSPIEKPVDSSTKKGSEADDTGRKVLILGSLHGDEIASVSVVFRWMDFIDRTKPDSFLRKNTYLFFPLINPDGFYAKPRTRTNANGVDINRNFSSKSWSEKALLYWKRKTRNDPRRYPGKKAGSEVETQVVEKWIEKFDPDLIISVHAPYSLLDHDGPIEFPAMKSPLPVKALGAYPGSLGTYAGIERGIPVVTPEFPSATQIISPKALEELFVFIMKAKY